MTKNQNLILKTMKARVDSIREYRYATGDEHPRHKEIWQEIDTLYNQLDWKHQEEFNWYCD